jgi:hypothetical protein
VEPVHVNIHILLPHLIYCCILYENYTLVKIFSKYVFASVFSKKSWCNMKL